jgi:HK97 family phage prohead protease
VDETGAARVGGQVTRPSGTERLHQYWVHGEGAAKIAWGSPGDWARCVAHLGKYIGDPAGYCDLAHHAATGMWPAQHAEMTKKETGRSAVTTPAGDHDADGLDSSWDGDHSDLPDLTGLGVHHFEQAAADMGMAPSVDPAQRAAPKLGSGARFAKLKSSLAAKGASDPGALAAWIGRRKFGKAKFGKLAAKARGGGASRAEPPPWIRTYELEDIHIVRAAQGDSTGRLVEAYAAVFNQAAEIQDFEGHYLEEIDPAAFNKVVADVSRSRAGFGKVKVMYNHGMTIHGTPSERGSMPIGTPVDIRPEARGLLTLTRYSETPFADEVLENIRNGAITAQSFTGRIVRSSPPLRRGDRYRPAGGQLPRVRRDELGLKEYGPTPFEAYTGAEILGVRMSPPGTWQAAGGEEYEDAALPPDGEAAPGEPPAEGEHSARYHQHALYRMTSEEKRKAAGLVW